jgi:acyl-CoA synthetase (AMP-forming)/AMP-acid ligase II
LSPFKLSKEYIAVGELPKSPAGKLLKRELRGKFSGTLEFGIVSDKF